MIFISNRAPPPWSLLRHLSTTSLLNGSRRVHFQWLSYSYLWGPWPSPRACLNLSSQQDLLETALCLSGLLSFRLVWTILASYQPEFY